MTKTTLMTTTSETGLFGNFKNKNKDKLLKISEVSEVKIYQVVKFKLSKIDLSLVKIDNLLLPNNPSSVSANSNTRIQWNGPKMWTIISNKNIIDQVEANCPIEDFAITDLSHSRIIIQINGDNAINVIKKGCPINLNEFKANSCANSLYHGIALSIDMINDKPNTFNLMAYRSFADSIHHAITDASLEYGYEQL